MSIDTSPETSVPPVRRYDQIVSSFGAWFDRIGIHRAGENSKRRTYWIGASGKEYFISRDPTEVVTPVSIARGDRVKVRRGNFRREIWQYYDFKEEPDQPGSAYRRLYYYRIESPTRKAGYIAGSGRYTHFGEYFDTGRTGLPEPKDTGVFGYEALADAARVDVFAKFEELQKDLAGGRELEGEPKTLGL